MGQRLVAIRFDPGAADVLPPGTEVRVELLRENLFLLPEEGVQTQG